MTNIDPAIVEAVGLALLDGLCDSPVWEGRHVGELELHICDAIAAERLAPHIAAAVKAAKAEGFKRGTAAIVALIKQESATLHHAHRECNRGLGCKVCVGVTARLDHLAARALAVDEGAQ